MIRVLLILVHSFISLKAWLINCVYIVLKNLYLFYKTTSFAQLQRDGGSLQRLPIHLGVLFEGDSKTCSGLADVIAWSIAIGVTYVSVYDKTGLLKISKSQLEAEVQKRRKTSQQSSSDVHFHNEIVPKNSHVISGQHVILLSSRRGISSLATLTKSLSASARQGALATTSITPCYVDSLLQDQSGFPDPDLVLSFGDTHSLLGYLPWQTRLTEIMFLPGLRTVSYPQFKAALDQFGTIEQRVGR